ncbi:MAG: uroporphyrinogen-III synthase [Rickettsia endosymbiont of Ixodes persulcatus]|nr:uroporphyrinogen-III synthase [Rickettsia endosymbiont of Ixodes persulcatus]MCZ6903319.1 uroporphyrinogen-III synthase [Rickettsia endosymbiont of Ixodes persulcatus]MCZ6909260.1 uroporphyrinogen-III synthase [Rickettsia endosymbiont of Ixodes persulcatus]MCZ6910015.1 uroporphyrinogen-III synthase [Rickettsia endosymbiont of Ixodes persulcatus]MCZ6913475.1 uroporphyrinogen-III synthase [Rickettsia endosymbiont of Ixodes persulcatus]
MKSVLLTRSLEENRKIIKEMSKYNLDLHYIHCPLIKYKTLDFNINILDNYSNIIITSKYAAIIIAEYYINQNIWVVGNTSKKLLENKGLKVAYTAKNVEDLIEHFPPNLYEQTIYLSSNDITKDLPNKIARHIMYNVEYLNELPVSIIKEFEKNIEFILFYSQNSAKTLVKLLLQSNLLQYLQDSLVVAISLKVANIVRPFIKNVVYCDDQNSNDIIKLLSENAKI